MLIRAVLISLAIAAVQTGSAHAQPKQSDAERRRAKAHFVQAQEHFNAGAFDRAAAEYQAAYEIVPEPGLLFNIGLCRENLDEARAAIDLYRRYLALAETGAKATEARARMLALQTHLDAERAARDRARAVEREERARLERERRPIEDPGPPPSLLPGLSLLAVSVVAAGAGVAFELDARDLRREIDRELENATPPIDSADPRFDEGRSVALRATLAWGLAGVTGVAGALLTVRALRARRSPPGASVRPGARGADVGVTLEVRW